MSFVAYSLLDPEKGTANVSQHLPNSVTFSFPCSPLSGCAPYQVILLPAQYRFECWGAKGGTDVFSKQCGAGAYAAGTVAIPRSLSLLLSLAAVAPPALRFKALPEASTEADQEENPGAVAAEQPTFG
jgi:hypothetical protein